MKPFLIIICWLFSLSLSAQNFYFNLQRGDGFATEAGQVNYIASTDEGRAEELVTDGFGEGTYFRTSLGYNFNSFVSLDFGVNYLRGKTITYEYIYTFISIGDTYKKTTSENINTFIFTPQLRFNIPTRFRIQPYIQIGGAIGVLPQKSFHQIFHIIDDNSFQRIRSETEKKLDGGIPLGFTAALGAKYSISKTFSLIVDLELLNMSYQPRHSVTTKYIRDDVNELEDMTVKEREVIYKKEIKSRSSDDNEPRIALPINFPMSNVSLNIGFQFDF
ncbi:MAG: outer membrane beta-barrel protein [Saprospiraceae bacterium]